MQNPDGTRVDISGWSIASRLADSRNNAIHVFQVTITDAAQGEYQIFADKSYTRLWPVDANCKWDIQYTDASNRDMSTETIAFEIVRDQT